MVYAVGKINGCLKTKIGEHQSGIRTGNRKSPIAPHFIHAGYPINSLGYIGSEKINMFHTGGDTDRSLLQMRPFGSIHWTLRYVDLNEKINARPFLSLFSI